jgi:hypothetical protein
MAGTAAGMSDCDKAAYRLDRLADVTALPPGRSGHRLVEVVVEGGR